MPRPKKCRSVCALPRTKAFWPEGESDPGEAVVLTVEEYEAIRLIDREGLSQEQCSEQMQVARTTVQQIYACARKKLADALVCGLPLRIAGGDYRLCSGGRSSCGHGPCCRRKQMEAKMKGEAGTEIPDTPVS